MRKLYFLGGENVLRRDARNFNASAFQSAGGSPNVLVFSWARPSFDVSYKRRTNVENYFRILGAKTVSFAGYSDSFEELKSKIDECELVYLTGGQLGVLLTRLKSRGVDRLLRDFDGVIVGRSAGALVMGADCLVTNRYSKRRKVSKGLRFVDFSVKVHYESWQDNLLIDYSKNRRVFAIPRGSGVIFALDKISFVGEVFLFNNGAKMKVSC